LKKKLNKFLIILNEFFKVTALRDTTVIDAKIVRTFNFFHLILTRL
jgi:hypothetical protein